MALKVGTNAPNFTLQTKTSTGLEAVTLSDEYAKKRVLLLFFPFAFTSVCVDEMCQVNASLSEYAALNASVFGVSVDSPFSLEKMADADQLKFPLLSDFNKTVASAYDVLFADLLGFKGVAKRAAFVIDTDGRILYSESSDDPKKLPNFDAIKAALQA